MLYLTPPTTGAREAFQLCISEKISPAKLALLSAFEEPVVQAAERYEAACRTASLHRLDRTTFNPPGATATATATGASTDPGTVALLDMYERRLRDKEHPGRHLFESILNRRTKCPLCGIAKVGQVDHHLPKSRYAYLSVVPINLVPVCERCNFEKSNRVPSRAEEQSLHPYFDNIEEKRWLKAEFLVQDPVIYGTTAEATSWEVRFFVDPLLDVDPGLALRIDHHFTLFKLGELFEAQTSDELVTASLQMEEVFAVGGSDDVRASLLDIARFRSRPRINNWMTAMYEALAASDWYCSGGFTPVALG